MNGIRYKFVKLEGASAIFTREPASIPRVFLSLLRLISKDAMKWSFSTDEEGCKELYEEAGASDNSRGNIATSDSKEEARHAFYAIRAYKQQHGIPFDTEDLK